MVLLDSMNSNWELTIDIVDKLISPSIEAEDISCQSAILCDDYKGHIKKEVKEHMINKYTTTNLLIRAGGITPKDKALDNLISNIWKDYCFDECYGFILIYSVNEKTGQPLPQNKNFWLRV